MTYHHGDLPRALLEAAEHLLETQGLTAVSLRAVARASGVSHAAPKNHYGGRAGLLSALAASGFERLRAHAASVLGQSSKPDRLHALGVSYVLFAREHSGLFALMFRSELLDVDSVELRSARSAMLDLLSEAAEASGPRELSLMSAERMALAWAQVHGLAVLLLEGQLTPLISRISGELTESAFLDHVLAKPLLQT